LVTAVSNFFFVVVVVVVSFAIVTALRTAIVTTTTTLPSNQLEHFFRVLNVAEVKLHHAAQARRCCPLPPKCER
jgi:hypothetical protein